MLRFIKSVKLSLATGNWFSALFVSLSLPDICGKIESLPDTGSKARYQAWFTKYMARHYTSEIGPGHDLHVFLSPTDCYALRCALLHEGEDEIGNQPCRKVLDRFHFTINSAQNYIHCNQVNNVLQLDVKIFCEQICQGVEQWLKNMAGNKDVQTQLASLAVIYNDICI